MINKAVFGAVIDDGFKYAKQVAILEVVVDNVHEEPILLDLLE